MKIKRRLESEFETKMSWVFFVNFQALAGNLLRHPVRRAIHDVRHFRNVPQSLPPLPRQRTRGLQGPFAEDHQLVCPPRVPAGVASHRPAHHPASCHTGEEWAASEIRVAFSGWWWWESFSSDSRKSQFVLFFSKFWASLCFSISVSGHFALWSVT